MSTLTLCIIASASGAYFIWGYQTFSAYSKPGEGPSFASMLLWSIIDTIMWWSTARAHNDQTLIATYTILTVALTTILIAKKKYGWKPVDWFVAGIACICLVVSYLTPPIIAVTAGALSISAAGIPNIIGISKLEQKPTALLYWTIVFFMTGPLLILINLRNSGAEIKEYIYPSIAVTYWSIVCSISLFKTMQFRRPVIS